MGLIVSVEQAFPSEGDRGNITGAMVDIKDNAPLGYTAEPEDWPEETVVENALQQAAEKLARLHCYRPVIEWMQQHGTVYDSPQDTDWKAHEESLYQLIGSLSESGVRISMIDNILLQRRHRTLGTTPSQTWHLTPGEVYQEQGRSSDRIIDPFVYIQDEDFIHVPYVENYPRLAESIHRFDRTYIPTPQQYVDHILHELAARTWFTMMQFDKRNKGEGRIPLRRLGAATIRAIESAVMKAAGQSEAAALHNERTMPLVRRAMYPDR